jgi:CheY-like chemotaxis protein
MSILFVDDDPDDTDLFCEAVAYINNSDFVYEKNSVQCMAVNNGNQAIDVLTTLTELPDYIFLDINMPLMNGEECLKHIRANARFSNIPVIMFSTAFNKRASTDLMALGASDCILKPNGFNALVKVLSNYIYKKQLH